MNITAVIRNLVECVDAMNAHATMRDEYIHKLTKQLDASRDRIGQVEVQNLRLMLRDEATSSELAKLQEEIRANTNPNEPTTRSGTSSGRTSSGQMIRVKLREAFKETNNRGAAIAHIKVLFKIDLTDALRLYNRLVQGGHVTARIDKDNINPYILEVI